MAHPREVDGGDAQHAHAHAHVLVKKSDSGLEADGGDEQEFYFDEEDKSSKF